MFLDILAPTELALSCDLGRVITGFHFAPL